MRLGVGGTPAAGIGVFERREGVLSAIITVIFVHYPIAGGIGEGSVDEIDLCLGSRSWGTRREGLREMARNKLSLELL